MYSYAIIIEAAKSAQNAFDWGVGSTISDLTFSSKWVRNFLTRGNMRRRKITTDDIVLAEEEEVVRIMSIGQSLIREYGYGPDDILNMDETAFTYAIEPE